MKFCAHEFKWFHSRKKSKPILTVTWTSFSLSGTYHGWPMRGWKAYQYFIPTEKMDSTVRYTRKISRKVFMRLVSLKRFNCYLIVRILVIDWFSAVFTGNNDLVISIWSVQITSIPGFTCSSHLITLQPTAYHMCQLWGTTKPDLVLSLESIITEKVFSEAQDDKYLHVFLVWIMVL